PLLEEVNAQQAGGAAERGKLRLLVRRRLSAVRSHPQRIDLGAEPLRGAPRAPQDSLRLRLRLHECEDALRNRLLAQRFERLRMSASLDVLRDFTEHELPKGREVLVSEEVLQRNLGALLRVDLARAQALLQLFGREIDEHDLIGVVEDAVRKGLANAD